MTLSQMVSEAYTRIKKYMPDDFKMKPFDFEEKLRDLLKIQKNEYFEELIKAQRIDLDKW
jgi:hypothetical protein